MSRDPRPDPNGWEKPYDDDPPDDGANKPQEPRRASK